MVAQSINCGWSRVRRWNCTDQKIKKSVSTLDSYNLITLKSKSFFNCSDSCGWKWGKSTGCEFEYEFREVYQYLSFSSCIMQVVWTVVVSEDDHHNTNSKGDRSEGKHEALVGFGHNKQNSWSVWFLFGSCSVSLVSHLVRVRQEAAARPELDCRRIWKQALESSEGVQVETLWPEPVRYEESVVVYVATCLKEILVQSSTHHRFVYLDVSSPAPPPTSTPSLLRQTQTCSTHLGCRMSGTERFREIRSLT